MRHKTKKLKIVVICGPTCVGKTSFAVELAKEKCGEIISADSMQVYRLMNIGTAKPTPYERALVRHHMIDIVDPDEPCDAARFAKLADSIITKLHSKGKIPFIVGGTGLYIKALLYGLSSARPYNPDILERLKNEAKEHPPCYLHNKLKKCDIEAAKKIHPNDTFRLIRALEIFETSGIPASCHHKEHRFANNRFDALKIGLKMDKDLLYERINTRVDMMIKEGLIDEVKRLLDTGYSETLKPMRAIGYRHMVGYIKKRINWDEAVRTLKRDTRRYAKRQLTWFNADPEIFWTSTDNKSGILTKLNKFFSK